MKDFLFLLAIVFSVFIYVNLLEQPPENYQDCDFLPEDCWLLN